MSPAEAACREAIRDLLARCAQAGDAGRAEEYGACFAEDGVLALDPPREGRAAIRALLSGPPAIAPPPGAPAGFVSHHLTTCRIDLGPEGAASETAAVRTYWFVVTAIGPDHSGVYDDRLVRKGGAWRIARRRPRTLWVSPHSLIAGR